MENVAATAAGQEEIAALNEKGAALLQECNVIQLPPPGIARRLRPRPPHVRQIDAQQELTAVLASPDKVRAARALVDRVGGMIATIQDLIADATKRAAIEDEAPLQPPAANDRAPGAELAPKGPRAKARRTERIERAPSSQECIEAFRRDIADAGIRMTGDIIANTPKIQRFHVVDQKKGTRNGWYRLFIDDGGAAGAFGDYKTGIKVKWSMKGAKPLTREERRDLAAKAKADKEQREAEEAERQANAAEVARSAFNAAAEAPAHHPYLKRKGVKSYGLRVAEWVKEWTDEETGEVHTKRVPNALLVPIRSPESKAPVSLQAIFPSAKNPLGRDKDFLSRARKRGCYFVIGKPVEINGRVVIVICEGYATGASIYEAVHETSGAVVIVAFDAGNLKPVAEHFRGMLPNAAIVIAGDNDVWTDTPIKNPGATRATEAARAIDGVAALPRFADLEGKPTDFNDLHAREGLEMVERQVLAPLMAKLRHAPPAAASTSAAPVPAEQRRAAAQAQPQAEETRVEDVGEEKAKPQRVQAETRVGGVADEYPGVEQSTHFVFMGHDRDRHFFFQRQAGQVLSYSGKELMADGALTDLAPLQWWEMSFPAKEGMNKKSAADWVKRTSYSEGIFTSRNRIRGRGAWIDNEHVVFHLGNRLLVDGREIGIEQIKSRYIYERREELPMPANYALTDQEGARLLETARLFRWERDVSGVLFGGWVALAPICGALQWRPHGWITGEAGCGKTTAIEDFAYPLLNGVAVYAQGNSSEAGIRQDLAGDSLPVVFDESEANNEREGMRIDGILALVRQSSSRSNARTLKGTPGGKGIEFHVQSMFMLSSIGVSMKLQPDLERIAKLTLKKAEKGDEAAVNHWRRKLAPRLAEISRDKTIGARLLRRALDLLPVTLGNIQIFREVYTSRLGSQRSGDQYGTLLAGAWSLSHSGPVTRGEAEAFIESFEWGDHLEQTEIDEPSRARGALLGAKVRFDGGRELSVHELVCIAAGRKLDYATVEAKQAGAILKRHGMLVRIEENMKPEDGVLLFQNNSSEIPKLLAGHAYSASWRDQLLRAGAKKHIDGDGDQKSEWFHGSASKCIELPLKPILDDGVEECQSFADDDEGPPF